MSTVIEKLYSRVLEPQIDEANNDSNKIEVFNVNSIDGWCNRKLQQHDIDILIKVTKGEPLEPW